jgi:2-haloacid dehalogenase
MQLRALVFDAYGTLFDVHSVTAMCDRLWPGKGAETSRLWRAKQLEYTWLRSLMRRYEDFGRITEAALRYACDALRLPLDDARVRALLDAYLTLEPFPEVRDTLAELSRTGLKLAVLSNGSPPMLRPLMANAGLRGCFSKILSVDVRGIYKPAPDVYRLAVSVLGIPKSSIGFVSSNCWDACGAKSFGFRVFWVNRTAAPIDLLGAVPDHVIPDLARLPSIVRPSVRSARGRRAK